MRRDEQTRRMPRPGSASLGLFLAAALSTLAAPNARAASESRIAFEEPIDNEMVADSDLSFALRLEGADLQIESLTVTLDGNPVPFATDSADPGPGQLVTGDAGILGAAIPMPPGDHEWAAEISSCSETGPVSPWIARSREEAASLDPLENSGRSGARCSAVMKRADSRDRICRFRLGLRAFNRGLALNDSSCDRRIRRAFRRATARSDSCPVEDAEARIEANRSQVAAQLGELGLDSASSPGTRCKTTQAIWIIRHRRCEASAQVRERRGRDASTSRARCDQRLETMWDWIANRYRIATRISFEAASFPLGDDCDPTNSASCGLPFPNISFMDDVGIETATGYRMNIPQEAIPTVNGEPIRADHWDTFDGFSPTAPILMNFPNSQVDLEASGAPILQEARCCGQSQSTPYEDIRVRTPMGPNGPTVLIDLDTGQSIPHFVELDSRTTDPARQVLFLRPDASLKPGGHYAVAVRNLVDTDGNPVGAEPAFRALRDGPPTRIAAIEERRPLMDDLFARLRGHGIATDNLVLAFQFVVRSDEQLRADMLWMRDDALRWIDENRFEPTLDLAFNLDPANYDFDCKNTGSATALRLRGHLKAPFYLRGETPQGNPAFANGQTLARDENGRPERVGLHNLPFDIGIPCTVFNGETEPTTLMVGHGLFGTGAGMVNSVSSLSNAGNAYGIEGVDFVAVGTDFRGLSAPDQLWVGLQIVGFEESQLNNFPQFVARLQQGMVNQLVLSHVMKTARFVNCEAINDLDPEPCRTYAFGDYLAPAGKETFYYGASLGGVMGIFQAALSPDITRFIVDVGAINFGMLLQRSTQFITFEVLTESIGLTDPMETALGLSLLHEIWVSAEPAGYARHVTGTVDAPLPGSPPKKILMPVAWLDKQVSNEASVIAARSLGIPNISGSLLENIPGMTDAPSPQDSGFFVWDAGSFDIFDPAYDGVIPTLSNQIPSDKCDPHARRVEIPAALEQLALFARPGGQVFNTCGDGVCDASSEWERPNGSATVCNPL